jgi:hypothetical protein
MFVDKCVKQNTIHDLYVQEKNCLAVSGLLVINQIKMCFPWTNKSLNKYMGWKSDGRNVNQKKSID